MFGRMHSGKGNNFWKMYKFSCMFILLQEISIGLSSFVTPLFSVFRAVDHQWDGDLFATSGAQVDIWNHNRLHLKSCLTRFLCM